MTSAPPNPNLSPSPVLIGNESTCDHGVSFSIPCERCRDESRWDHNDSERGRAPAATDSDLASPRLGAFALGAVPSREEIAARLDMINAGFQAAVQHELRYARELHPGAIVNYHDAYGRLVEEVSEFFDEVRLRDKDRRPEDSLKELIQIAAMAQRAAEDLNLTPALPVYYAERS